MFSRDQNAMSGGCGEVAVGGFGVGHHWSEMCKNAVAYS
jgi:hypothetical protein